MLKNKIDFLWQISRTALANMPTVPTRWDRMQYVKQELNKTYPELIKGMTPKQVWNEIDYQTAPFKLI